MGFENCCGAAGEGKAGIEQLVQRGRRLYSGGYEDHPAPDR
jgi:hypothetical protein